MGLTGNEVSAENRQRRYEELSKSPVGSVLESAATIAGSVVAVGSRSVTGTGTVGLAIAGSVVAGLGIVDWFRKLGTSKVSENLEALGEATEDALKRIESTLEEQGKAIDDLKRVVESDEFRDAMAGASLQALRTTSKDRIKRLALILANGVRDEDLAPESTDDMMRAAVELKSADIVLLGKIYDSQAQLVKRRGSSPEYWFTEIQTRWSEFLESGPLNASEHLKYRSSLSRLESHGLIQRFREVQTARVGLEPYALLEEGLKLFEHLREVD